MKVKELIEELFKQDLDKDVGILVSEPDGQRYVWPVSEVREVDHDTIHPKVAIISDDLL